jgi:hypothetical protein
MGTYRTGKLISTARAFCTWWPWWDISLHGISRFIMAWGSIERHFLIFNISLMATKTKRWIFHILPTLITATYPLFFYTFAVILHTCEIPLSYTVINFNVFETKKNSFFSSFYAKHHVLFSNVLIYFDMIL